MYIKDLSIIPRSLKDIIIIDNLPDSYLRHPNNGLPIRSWVGDPEDVAFEKMISVLQILKTIDDVRPFIKQSVIGGSVSLYKLYELIGHPKGSSPIQGIIGSIRGLKDEAAAFLGFSEKDSTNDNTTSRHSEQDDQENSINGSNKRYGVKLSLPVSSKGYSKSDYSDPEPLCDTNFKVKDQNKTSEIVDMGSIEDSCIQMPEEYPKRMKPYNVKLTQKKLFSGIDEENGDLAHRISVQPRTRHPLLNLHRRNYKQEQAERNGQIGKRHAHSLGMINQHPEAPSNLFDYLEEDSDTSFDEECIEELSFE